MTMHFANAAKSKRIQKFLAALKGGKVKTTRQLIEETGLCAINSIAAECNAQGINIVCEYKGTNEDGARIYTYKHVKEKTA